MKKNKDKKINEQQARPAPEEIIPEEKNIPVREDTEDIADKDTVPQDGVQEPAAEQSDSQTQTDNTAQTTSEIPDKEGEKTSDTPEENKKAVFDKDGWKSTVAKFFAHYPVAKRFAAQIGDEIAKDQSLHYDDECLEKALLRVLCREYTAPETLATDESFLKNHVYSNESVRQAIVDDYLDNLQKSMPVRAISSGGQITLTPPSRPKSIEEAGAVITTMLNNRRI